MKKLALLPLAALALIACSDTAGLPTALTPGKALRDNLHSGGNALVAATNTVTITAGGTATVSYWISQTNNDGEHGCNATPTSPAKVDVLAPAGVTPTPASLKFTDCGTGNSQNVVFSSSAVGSHAIKAKVTDSGTGTYTTDKADFTLTVQASQPAAPSNTAPSISLSGVTGGAAYNKGSVPAAMCQVTDTEDGNSSFAATLSTVTGTYASDGIGSQTASCSYTDGGGLSASTSVSYSIVDPSAPVITHLLNPAAPPTGSNGWYKGDVSLTWTVSEPQSPNSLAKTGCVDQSIAADQAEATYSCSATSAGGSAAQVDVKIKRDATAPTVSLSGGPADGVSYFWGSVPAAPTCNASDATSGLASCVVSGYGTEKGKTYTVKATATDNAGNVSTAEATYKVVAWDLKGFYSPVTMGALNGVKAGSTVPLKFEIFTSEELTSTTVVKSFKAQAVACGTLTALSPDEVDFTTTERSGLRYDTTNGQFIYNWQTSKTPGCFVVTLTTQDDSQLVVNFQTR